MKRTAHWSLARQQWLGLAALSLLGLALVSGVVYAMTAGHLQARQQESLQNMSRLVIHLLQEQETTETPNEAQELPALLARLDEHFSGHADLALQIWDAQGQLRYRSPHQLPEGHSATWDFSLPAPQAGAACGKPACSKTKNPTRNCCASCAGFCWPALSSALPSLPLAACG